MLLKKKTGMIVRFECESKRKVGCCSRYRVKEDSRGDLANLEFTRPYFDRVTCAIEYTGSYSW